MELSVSEIRDVQKGLFSAFVSICEKNDLSYFLIGGTLLGAVRHQGFIPWDDDIDVGMPREDYDKFLALCSGELRNSYKLLHYTLQPEIGVNFIKIEDIRTRIHDSSRDHQHRVNGVFIDVFPLDASPSNKLLFHLQRAVYRFGDILVGLANAIDKPRSTWKQLMINSVKYFLHGNSLMSFRRGLEKVVHKPWTSSTEWVCNYLGVWGDKERFPRSWINEDVCFLEFEGKQYPVINDYDSYLTHLYGDYMVPPSKADQEEARHFTEVFWRE